VIARGKVAPGGRSPATAWRHRNIDLAGDVEVRRRQRVAQRSILEDAHQAYAPQDLALSRRGDRPAYVERSPAVRQKTIVGGKPRGHAPTGLDVARRGKERQAGVRVVEHRESGVGQGDHAVVLIELPRSAPAPPDATNQRAVA